MTQQQIKRMPVSINLILNEHHKIVEQANEKKKMNDGMRVKSIVLCGIFPMQIQ